MGASAQEIAEKLAWEFDTRTAIEIHVKMELRYNRLPESLEKLDFNTVDQTYIETAAGQRFFDQQMSLDGKPFSRHSDYCDVKRSGRLGFDRAELDRQESLTIKRFFGNEERSGKINRPPPLDLLTVGRRPLGQALVESGIPLGESTVIGRPCDLFLFERVPLAVPQDHVYSLDHATGIPLQVAAYLDHPARAREEPVWTWTASSLDEVAGHHIPLRSRSVVPVRGPEPGITRTYDYTVSSVVYNQPYAASTFWPVYQPGLGIDDTITKKTSVAPGKRPEPRVGVQEPIRATPPPDNTRVGSFAFLGLGVALVALGLFAYWRRAG